MDSLEATLEASCHDNLAALKVLEAIKVALFEDGDMSRYNQAAVDVLYQYEAVTRPDERAAVGKAEVNYHEHR